MTDFDSRLEPPAAPQVFSVSELARSARILIEERLGLVLVEGELSNFRRPGSGHWYFTLKDQSAQIRCAMFAGRNRTVRINVNDGLQVRIRGRVSLYEPRGDFQIIVEHLQGAGEGALRAAFDALKSKLAAEGLFEPARKRPLPAHPRHLTIISSAATAALRDVLHVIERRFPALTITLIESAVQGDGAPAQLIRALERAAARPTDVVLITRGGGSLEDLWAFNVEAVVRAVAACPHPVVSAIGHQTDFTITDFVADVRAPTPSAGAELITPTLTELSDVLKARLTRLSRSFSQDIRYQHQQVAHLGARLVSPRTLVELKMQRTDELAARLQRAWLADAARRSDRAARASRTLSLLAPARQLPALTRRLAEDYRNLVSAARRQLDRRGLLLESTVRALSAVSPLNTMNRGYAVLTRSATLQPVTSVSQVSDAERLTAHLADGALEVTVNAIDRESQLARLDAGLTHNPEEESS